MQERDKGKAAVTGSSSELRGALRQPSIKDIARLAKVSHPTVSRALQNSPLVNAQTAEKIRRIAAESGYRASAVARGLVTRRTRTIGLVVTTVADPFASEVVCGIEQTANDHGYSVFLADSNADPERERKVVQAFAERRVDGIIVTSSRVGALYLPMLAEMNVPIVLVNDQYPGAFVHSVMIANFEGMYAVAEHLLALGHRRIAYLGDQFGYQSDAERLAGYRAALKKAGVAAPAELVANGDGEPEAAVAAMEKLLALAAPPTAVCCYNDMSALGAMRQIGARGFACLKIFRLSASTIFSSQAICSRRSPPCASPCGAWERWRWRASSSSCPARNRCRRSRLRPSWWCASRPRNCRRR
jgi:DNA-binding LacI/PurR family transcriptional regulator